MTEPWLVPRPETPGFPSKIRLLSNTNTNPNTCAPGGNYRPYQIIHGNAITLAHSDELHVYAEIWENSWKRRFHELERESKTRLLKTHSHTSERRGYEADKEFQVKREERRPVRKGQKNVKEKPPPHHLEWGAAGRTLIPTCRRRQV